MKLQSIPLSSNVIDLRFPSSTHYKLADASQASLFSTSVDYSLLAVLVLLCVLFGYTFVQLIRKWEFFYARDQY